MNKDVEYDYNKFIKIDRIYIEIRKLEKPIKQECIDSWFYCFQKISPKICGSRKATYLGSTLGYFNFFHV